MNYAGEISHNEANGKGIATLSNGILYSGEWKQGKPHGKGKLTATNPFGKGVVEGSKESELISREKMIIPVDL